ncbi:hypothetical protein GF373_10415 [bacterium]|nr:hypothetical protein [bacterium]
MKQNSIFSLRKCAFKSLHALSHTLSPLERIIAKKWGEEGIRGYPPVFIVGAPRSGTTLLYQVLSEKYHFSFLSNFVSHLYGAPILATYFARHLGIKKDVERFQSSYGQTTGLGSPSECGRFWYRCFPKGRRVYVGNDEIPRKNLQRLREAIGGIAYVIKAPGLYKNTFNSMRIAPLIQSIPEASFIVCKRDPLQNALSILRARIQIHNDPTCWWSLPPREFDQILSSPYSQQVVEQVYYIYNQIEIDKNVFGKERFLDIQYEDFCHDVSASLEKIASFLKKRNHPLFDFRDVPCSFPVRTVEAIDPLDRQAVAKTIPKYFGGNYG